MSPRLFDKATVSRSRRGRAGNWSAAVDVALGRMGLQAVGPGGSVPRYHGPCPISTELKSAPRQAFPMRGAGGGTARPVSGISLDGRGVGEGVPRGGAAG